MKMGELATVRGVARTGVLVWIEGTSCTVLVGLASLITGKRGLGGTGETRIVDQPGELMFATDTSGDCTAPVGRASRWTALVN